MKIAGVQMDIRLGDVPYNLQRIRDYVRKTAGEGADLVVFPECAVTGYCFESLEEAMQFAEPLPGPVLAELISISVEFDVFVVSGLLERDGQNLFNACVCVGPSGLCGSYRKVHLPQLGVDHFTTPGDRPFAVHAAGDLRIGMIICYDASFPEAARALTLGGAELIVLPTNWPPGSEPTAAHVVNARASENKVFFIAVNRVGSERGFQFIGHSKICDVHGVTLAEAAHREEAVIYAEIDPSEARDKRIVRVPGKHSVDRLADRRPAFYSSLVEEKHTARESR